MRWRNGAFDQVDRVIPEETAVALVHDASTTAVMMATPDQLEDFAIGFSLTEGLIDDVSDIRSLEVVDTHNGVEVRMWLTSARSTALAERRRALVGPSGCGLCGVESLDQAVRSPPPVTQGGLMSSKDVLHALSALTAAQVLGGATRSVHAAAFWSLQSKLLAIREDVGRHNALDKLVGALKRPGGDLPLGAVLLTSRVSVEMVQKAAVLGAPILVAMSAPTALALRAANTCGMTVIAVARNDGFEVFTHPERILSKMR